MARVRVMAPADRLTRTVRVLQDAGTVHLVAPEAEGLRAAPASLGRDEELYLNGILEDLEAALEALPPIDDAEAPREDGAGRAEPGGTTDPDELASLARRVRRRAGELLDRRSELERRASDLERFLELLERLDELRGRSAGDGGLRSWFLILRPEEAGDGGEVREALRERLGDDFELTLGSRGGDARAALLRARGGAAQAVDEVLARAGVEEIGLPGVDDAATLDDAVEAAGERRDELREEIGRVDRARSDLVARHGRKLEAGGLALVDRLARIRASRSAARTGRAVVLEGWVPEDELDALRERVAAEVGDVAAVERVSTEAWRGDRAPVSLSNPRLFRPFETIIRMLPLPAYGSIDPTPFVAVFFPMFFGIVLGDVAYGFLLAGLAAWLHRVSDPESTLRPVSEVAGACAAFTVVFGLLYGELLGDLGHRLLGMEPLLMDREEALVPFLGLTVALGAVHVILGLVLGAASAVGRHPREALGRGLYAVMVLLVAMAILAAVRVLPGGFFTPAVVALLVAFPVLIVVEGVLAPVELISTLGSVLSYARIMALGTASVVMAVVANRLVGTVGSALVGALFGLLFHLVNFALGVFGPTIHGLRLHYVEFFDTFYSPGGDEYRPLRHARPPLRADASLNP